MKKQFTVYVISQVVKGRRTYLKEDYLSDSLRFSDFADDIPDAHFFKKKSEAEKLVADKTASDEGYAKMREEYFGDTKIRMSQPVYDVLEIEMKVVNK